VVDTTIWFLLMHVNHAINFYLYCITGSLFRQELCALFGRQTSVRSHHSNFTRPPSKRGAGTAAVRRQNAEDHELENIVN